MCNARLALARSWIATACILGATSTAALSGRVNAAEISAVAVSNEAATYHISFDAVADAPAQLVFEQLSDYAHLDRLSSVITSITVEPSPDGKSERVRSILRACLFLFCKEIVQVEDVTEPDRQSIVAVVVPGLGDFTSGNCEWHIENAGARTRIHYEATRTIAFWIPPIIGSWVIKHTMREQFESSVAALERMANKASGLQR